MITKPRIAIVSAKSAPVEAVTVSTPCGIGASRLFWILALNATLWGVLLAGIWFITRA